MIKNAEDIISLPIELRANIADSKFRLVHIASQRVRELSGGEQPLVVSRSIKDTTVALEESLLASYKVITGEEAQRAKEEMRKRKEQELLEEQLSAKEEEIRKELSAYLTESQDETEGAEAAGEPSGEEDSDEVEEESGGEEGPEE